MHVFAQKVDFYLLKLYTRALTSMSFLVHRHPALLQFHLSADVPKMLALQKAQQSLLVEVITE
jgi:hypothetical protein